MSFRERPAITVTTSVTVIDGGVVEARLAVGSVGATPVRLRAAEQALVGVDASAPERQRLLQFAEAAADEARAGRRRQRFRGLQAPARSSARRAVRPRRRDGGTCSGSGLTPRAGITADAGGLILAAGSGSRFGPESKLVEDLGGRPLLEYAIGAMCAVLAVDPIVVVLGAHADVVRARVRFGRAGSLVCEGWSRGISETLKCGVRRWLRPTGCSLLWAIHRP